MKLSRPLVTLDLETTGTWIEKDKIIEIAMVKCGPDGSRETYHEFVQPGMPIPPVVQELTGLDDDRVKDAPRFEELAKSVLEFLDGCDLAGFNLERFDLPLLERELKEAGHKFNWRERHVFDAQKVYHLNEKRDLEAAYRFYCQKDLRNAHSALADTEATLEIIAAQVKAYGDESESIDALAGFDYKNSSEFYDEERRFRWWNGRLYMMFGKYARRYCLQELVQKDKSYCQWILSSNFNQDVKDLIANALIGKFPIYSASLPGEEEGSSVE